MPIAGILGDQQAALVGQACFQPGEAKNTYGTGCFMLMNTGETPFPSTCGLLTTVAYQFGERKPVYALEGSIAIAGALVQWLRDNLGLIADERRHRGARARASPDNGGVDHRAGVLGPLRAATGTRRARGLIGGLTRFANKGHIARAALEATAFQTRDVLEAMVKDTGIAVQGAAHRRRHGRERAADAVPGRHPRRAGGAPEGRSRRRRSAPPMRPASRPASGPAPTSSPATGASTGAGRRRWPAHERERLYAAWKKAVARSLDWAG